jgi:hypothetical protein
MGRVQARIERAQQERSRVRRRAAERDEIDPSEQPSVGVGGGARAPEHPRHDDLATRMRANRDACKPAARASKRAGAPSANGRMSPLRRMRSGPRPTARLEAARRDAALDARHLTEAFAGQQSRCNGRNSAPSPSGRGALAAAADRAGARWRAAHRSTS